VATKTQVVFDCADTDRLARFWSEALHYKLQDPPAGFPTWQAALKAWNVPEEEWNSASAIVDPDGRGARIYFQQMDTPKPGKNRLHLDLNVSGGMAVPLETRKTQVNQEVDRLLRLGATKQKAWEEMDRFALESQRGAAAATQNLPPQSKAEPGEYWVVMQDPEGNEFCVQ
jgi:hypothetical protein